MTFRFIHAADLHIDSPLKGFDLHAGAPAERLRGATREALTRLVDLAIAERVAFVLIAGDLFDGPWPDMRTGIWTAQQFARLGQQQIPVYLLRGNHDAQSKVRQAVSWPDNVHELAVDAPETRVLDDLGVALHGQGFANQAVTQDLAAAYPAAIPRLVNIGMLHTSLTGDPQHDTYAPTSEEVLRSKGYDYWALGHVHQRRVVREADPHIAFSGNTQGRHVRETGAKGCSLVTVTDGRIAAVEFRPTDVLRWFQLELSLDAGDTLEDLYRKVPERLRACREQAEGRYAAVRLSVSGSCRAHRELTSLSKRVEVDAELHALATRVPELWLERVRLETTAPVDLARLRNGQDLLAGLFRELEAATRDGTRLAALAAALEPLAHRAPKTLADAGLRLDDPEQLRRWLGQAEGLLAALVETE